MPTSQKEIAFVLGQQNAEAAPSAATQRRDLGGDDRGRVCADASNDLVFAGTDNPLREIRRWVFYTNSDVTGL